MHWLVQATLAMALVAVAIAHYFPIVTSLDTRGEENEAARHVATIAEAAYDYASANWKTLNDALNITSPAAITVSALISQQKLPPTFVDITPFGHTHIVVFRRTSGTTCNTSSALSSCQVDVLVMGLGGQVIPDANLGRLAPLASSTHGFGAAVYSSNTTRAVSAIGNYVQTLSTFSVSGYAYSAGHLASMLHLNGTQALSPYVSRYSTPGDPTSGTMQSQSLNMGSQTLVLAPIATAGGSCTQAGAVAVTTAGTGQPYYCNDTTWQAMGGTSKFVIWF